jgi:MFS family permease
MVSETTKQRDGQRTFLIVWFGQVVSLVGSSLTWFGLSIWIFLETGSVTALAMVLLGSNLPRILLAPVAGALVDRWDRRWAMILSDLGSGMGTVIIAILFATDAVTIPALVIVAAFSSAFQAFQWPAYQAAISLLVPKDKYQRASGMVQMAEGISQVAAPMIAAAVIAWWNVLGLILIDVVTFVFAVTTLLIVRFPRPPRSKVGEEASGSLWQESIYGFKYLIRRHGLMGLLVFFAALNLAFGSIGPLLIAYMLSIGSELTLGTAMTIGSTGMIVGSIVASVMKPVKHRVNGFILSSVVLGLMLGTVALTASLPVIVGSIWIAMFTLPIGMAMSQSIWLSKVEPDVQGRVFSARSMIAQGTVPVALLLVGPLADTLFVPLMTGDSTIGRFLQSLLGSGEDRGYALFFMAIGVSVLIFCVGAYAYGPLRNLERDLPDHDMGPSDDDPGVSGVTAGGADLGVPPVSPVAETFTVPDPVMHDPLVTEYRSP